MTVVLTKKFLDTSNLNLIKVQNDVGRNRLASIFNKIIANPMRGIFIVVQISQFY